jgi:hypothetical protein
LLEGWIAVWKSWHIVIAGEMESCVEELASSDDWRDGELCGIAGI